MTKVEIEKLEALKWPPLGEIKESEYLVRLPWTTVPLDEYALIQAALPRLLEERKRLLEALRPFTEGAGAMTYRTLMYEYGMEHVVKQTDAALAAVKFAEAPAD